MTAAGLIFSNIHDKSIPELTHRRTMASVPFGCRYRLIDFTLSNMVNAGISKVGVITHNNYQSLMDHLGTGKDWDLARRSGGIKILPPFITSYAGATAANLYTTRLEALMGVTNFISHCDEDYIVLSDCDVICNLDLKDVIEKHIESGADITFVAKRENLTEQRAENRVFFETKDGRITRVYDMPKHVKGEYEVSLNIWVMGTKYLYNLLIDAMSKDLKSFNLDIVSKNTERCNFRIYEHEGYYAQICSMEEYFACNMEQLCGNIRNELFKIEDRPVYTKIRNSAPTLYMNNAKVNNSLIADGCVIEGSVENSIIFRGVKIGKNCVVKNSILMQDTYVGENVRLNCVITDKNVIIRDGNELSGYKSKPFFINKGAMV